MNNELIWRPESAFALIESQIFYYWTMNGKSFPDTQPIEVKQGDLVRVRFANISNGIHPMHLHGHDFRIIAEDGHPVPTPQIVSTVTVNPGETYDIDNKCRRGTRRHIDTCKYLK